MDRYQVCCGIMSALTAVDLTVLTQAFTMGGTGVKTFASAALAHGTHMLADAATSAQATLAYRTRLAQSTAGAVPRSPGAPRLRLPRRPT